MRRKIRWPPAPVVLFVGYFLFCRFLIPQGLDNYFLSQWALFNRVVPDKEFIDLAVQRDGQTRFFAREISRQARIEGYNTGPLWKLLTTQMMTDLVYEKVELTAATIERLRTEFLPICKCQSFDVVRIHGNRRDHIIWHKDLRFEVVRTVP